MPEPIKIIFLGTGAAIPSLKRHPAAILLQYGPDYMLFDCGEGTQLRLQKARVSPMKIDKIFITHWHADHFAGLLPMIETLHLSRRREPLHIYGPDATRFVDALYSLSYWGIGFPASPYECDESEETEKIFENDDYEIHSIRTIHSVPSVGYYFKEKDTWNINVKKAEKFGLRGRQLKKIKKDGKLKVGSKTVKIEDIAKIRIGKKIVYSGDTEISKLLFEMAEEADILIHDATFAEAVEERPHSSAADVAKMAKKYKIKKLILTHLSRRYREPDEVLQSAKKYFKNVIVAEDLMKIVLK